MERVSLIDSNENLPKVRASQVIKPIVERHVGDAAFYWSQLDRSTHSPLLNINGVLHFEKRLTAHLDGVVVADERGWQLAVASLRRWRGAGEMFVCASLVLRMRDRTFQQQRWLEILAILQTDPRRMLRGVIAALLRVSPAAAFPWIISFIKPDQPTELQVAAWRTLARSHALCSSFPPSELAKLLEQATANTHTHTDTNCHVLAAACRVSVMAGSEQIAAKLVQSPDRATSAEAAIALAQYGRLDAGLHHLWRAVWAQVEDTNCLTGAYKSLAAHRLARWVRHLGVLVPKGHDHVPRLLQMLPTRIALSFLLHHADDKHLDWIQAQLGNPQCARLAGWTWATLLGIDL